MSYTLPHTWKGWLQVKSELVEALQRWGVHDWKLDGDARGTNYNNGHVVSLTVIHKSGREIVLTSKTQATAKGNLRVLVLGIEAMRLNEKRGLAEVMQQAYAQLAAPAKERDPYEVLGVRHDTPMAVIDAAYRALAKTAHPDSGGSTDVMAEINAAYERVRSERGEKP